MRKILLLLVVLAFADVSYAQLITEQAKRQVWVQLNDLETRVQLLEEKINQDTLQMERLEEIIETQKPLIDSLQFAMKVKEKRLAKAKSARKDDINVNRELLSHKEGVLLDMINQRFRWAGAVGIGVVVLIFIIFIVSRIKSKTTEEKEDGERN